MSFLADTYCAADKPETPIHESWLGQVFTTSHIISRLLQVQQLVPTQTKQLTVHGTEEQVTPQEHHLAAENFQRRHVLSSTRSQRSQIQESCVQLSAHNQTTSPDPVMSNSAAATIHANGGTMTVTVISHTVNSLQPSADLP